MTPTRPLFFLWAICIAMPRESASQDIINAYAKVSGISGMNLTLTDENETYDNFQVGENIIIMQMQDDVIGTNTNNDASFGTISTISNAGLYENATITSRSGGVVQTIWSEDFEDLSDGTTVDNGTTAWSRSCADGDNSCYTGTSTLEVDAVSPINGALSFAGSDLDEQSVWTSETIDISGYEDVTISVNLSEVNFNQDTDYIRVYYSLDGGAEQQLSYTVTPQNNFNASVASTNTQLNGTSLVVVVRMRDSRPEEFAIFDDVVVRGTPPLTLTVENSLTNTYNTGTNSSVQVISFPTYASYTTTNDLTALAWDGNIGGVFAIDVTGTLTLANDISVDGLGFSGGIPNPTADGSGCDPNTYISNANTYARKGEGIYKVTSTNYQAARARVASGGGGASYHNAGGGGGGNFTQGGDGGPGWDGTADGCTPSAGGLGGTDLSTYITASRIFMGGGGGGGQQNNNVALSGGNGGGIIILRAATVVTDVGCGGVSITARGEDVVASGNDGGGGGGAGGSILFQVGTWSLSCQLTTEASGGTGGDVTFTTAHGGGGGGGRGVTIFSGTAPSSNYNSNNNQGTGGSNGTDAGAGSAPDGDTVPDNPDYQGLPEDGVIETEEGPLPVVLLFWKGVARKGENVLLWATASERDNHFFTLEKSLNGTDWETVTYIEGNGTTKERHDYQYSDRDNGYMLMYYRLSQTDFDGATEVFQTIVVRSVVSQANLLLYPNPTDGVFRIDMPGRVSEAIHIQAFDAAGREVILQYERNDNYLLFDFRDKPEGNYLLRVNDGVQAHQFRVVVQ